MNFWPSEFSYWTYMEYSRNTANQPGPSALDAMCPNMYRIERIRKETDDTFTLDLTGVSGAEGLAFAAGQFNMIYVYGVGEVPVSISGDPTQSNPLIHTVRAVGNVTKALRRLSVGETIGIRGPYGTGWPMERARGNDVVLITGGIGLAPLRPALYQILAERKKYGKVVLLYGTRTPQDILFRQELEQWRARFDLDVEVTVDRADESWRGNVGVVTTLIPRSSFDASTCIAMICGPEVMMRFTVLALQRRGVPAENTYVSMERNMKCAIGLCGHCQFGPKFVCKDGPVFSYDVVRDLFNKREI